MELPTRKLPRSLPGEHPEFIELDRRFQELVPGKDPEDLAVDSYVRSTEDTDPGLGWKDLLSRRLVVVLGEPGSGKTWEFENQAARLRIDRQIAFYIHLDTLIDKPLGAVLAGEELRRFDAWIQGSGTATFLLDSVDEAKFRKSNDFHTALKNMADSLGITNIGRANLLLSSRISEWHPVTDAHELRTRFQVPPPTRDRTEGILVVRMAPLDARRIEQFARGRGAKHVEGFLRALDDNHAWEFARRPVDVVDLINFWMENGRLGSLKELIESDIVRNLRPSPRDREDPLSSGESREGAEALGAAVVLCRTMAFRVPDDALLVLGAIDALECLPATWHNEQCNALLTRPLFDCASYGRIRFHHRRVAEYLAASWLEVRMRDGCPISVLNDLLTDHVGGRRVCRSVLAPVAAWLCHGDRPWNGDVRGWILEAAPEVHLSHGDPAGLGLDDKRQVLKSLAKEARERRRRWMDTSPDALSRLADPALSADVSAIIRDRSISQDLRIEMLDMARHGRMRACLDAALDVAASSDEVEALKAHAAAVIRDVGDPSCRLRLAQIAVTMETISSRVCAPLCEALYPGTIGTRDFIDLLCKTGPDALHSFSLPYHLASHLETNLRPDQAGELLSCILELLNSSLPNPLDSRSASTRKQFQWVGKLIPQVLYVKLRGSSLAEHEARLAGAAIWWLSSPSIEVTLDDDETSRLNEATKSHDRVRRHYFWRCAEEWRHQHQCEPPMLFDAVNGKQILHPNRDDLLWLVSDARNQPELKDRELALRFAVELWARFGGKWIDKRRIRRAIAGDKSLTQRFRELVAERRWSWFKRVWYQQIRRTIANGWWWNKQFHTLNRSWTWFRGEWIYLRHLGSLASGKKTAWLSELSREVLHQGSSQWGSTDWASLRKKRGRLIERATRAGCKRTWRSHVPLLPHERPVSSQTDHRVVVGLIGLQAAASDGELNISAFSEEEAKVATRYAVNELNGFPSWLAELADYHPAAVSEVLGDCINGEWRFPIDRQQPYEVLWDLVWSGGQLAALVQRRLLQLLHAADPPNSLILRFGLTLLLRQRHPPTAELIEMAAERVSNAPSDKPGFILWMAVWLQLDAGRALDELIKILSTCDTPTQVMMCLCAVLSGEDEDRPMTVATPDYLCPSHLRRLIPLAYRYIATEQDVERAGLGGYTPGDGDYAQKFREGLLGRLSGQDTPEAIDVLRELAQEPILAPLRDWILHLIDEVLEKQADLPAWTPADVRTFTKEYECDPRTDDDLFKIVRRRFDDIKHDVEKADTSIRRDLHEDDDEIRLRGWLSTRLTERSRNRYTVPQDAEIDQRQRPDLRVENPKVNGPVSIEIKWADNWTLQQLRDGLEKQLLGQYLRARNARYGLYVLGYVGRKQHWQSTGDNRLMTFQDVVLDLETRAGEIVKRAPNILGLLVVGIDFRDPSRRT